MQCRRIPTPLAWLALAAAIAALFACAPARPPMSEPASPRDVAQLSGRRASVTQRYDPNTGLTTVRASLPDVTAGVELSVSAVYAGGVLREPPDSVHLFITRASRERLLGQWDAMDIVVHGDDSVVVAVDEPVIRSRRVGGMYVEQVSTAVSAADFARIASARALGVQIGKLSFWVAGSPHDALRDFASRIAPRTRR
ncbi:MAG: hypothetical protein M3373_10505 [Gemmatimonadota bacterium]|nr:hypothetical protein [Gemmatimonadota bacterium]